MSEIISNLTQTPATIPLVLPTTGAEAPAAIATQRVLHVINGEHYSGAERVQDLLALELPSLGYEVGFACLKADRFPTARHAQDAALFHVPMRWRFDLDCVDQLADLIRDENYAIVHAHTPRSVLMGSMAAKRAGVPLVYHVHSPTARDSTRRVRNFINAKLEGWSLRNAAHLITVSPSLEQLMRDQGFAAERVTYVANGVPALDVGQREQPSGTWTLGMAALFRPRKGVEVLLETLAALCSQGADVHLRAVGPFETPEYEHEVKQLAERLGISGAITWTGFVDDVPAELEQIDLFILPSLFGEGLPMVVLEAMAAGVPVVASHVEGVPEAIRHRQDGLLVEPASVSQLTLAIEEIMAGKSLDYATLSESAKLRHSKHFSTRAMATGVANVYQKLLNNK
ncbi:MAG: glycosyltransferase family 4 protein [Planctomycetes bacterium]|nr:glycosyltransferase family 4 protein [Planctomycetota bacterium]